MEGSHEGAGHVSSALHASLAAPLAAPRVGAHCAERTEHAAGEAPPPPLAIPLNQMVIEGYEGRVAAGSSRGASAALPQNQPPAATVPRAAATMTRAALPAARAEGEAQWLDGRAPHVIEDHVGRAPAAAERGGFDGSASCAGARRERVTLRQQALRWTLYDEAEWLSVGCGEERMEDASEDEDEALGGVPALELALRGVDLSFERLDDPRQGTSDGISEGASDGAASLQDGDWQFAVSIAQIEVLERLSTATSDGGGEWGTMLGADSAAQQPRLGSDCFEFAAKRVAGEHRIRLRLDPLRAVLSQEKMQFLERFVASLLVSSAPPAAPADVEPEAAAPLFFQLVDVRPIHIRIDYRPRRVVELRRSFGSAPQVVSLFAVRDVRFSLGRLRLSALASWEALVASLLAEWRPQILAQLHRYLMGVTPLRSLARIATHVTELMMAPLRPAPLRGIHHSGASLASSMLADARDLLSFSLELLEQVQEQLSTLSSPSSSALALSG